MVKIILIDETSMDETNKEAWFNHLQKEITTKTLFRNEIQKQVDIFRRSLDHFLEPICPCLLFSSTVKIGEKPKDKISSIILEKIKDEQIIFKDFSDPRNIQIGTTSFYNLFEKFTIGIIVMDMLSEYKTVQTAFPNYNLTNKYDNPFLLNPDQNTLLKNYVHQLFRLKSLGYLHGDTHLGNAMFITDYDYIENARVMLIDFGKTEYDNQPSNLFNIVTNDLFWSYECLQNYVSSKSIKHRGLMNFYNKLSEIRVLSKKRYVERLILGNFDVDVYKLIDNYNYNSDNKISKIDIIELLKANKIPEISCQGNIDVLNINPTCNCCLVSQEHKFINYLIDGTAYTQEIVQEIFKNNIHTIFIGNDLLNNMGDSGIFLWVLGKGPDHIIRFYTIQVYTCMELASKHACLIQQGGIISLYAAGQLKYSRTNTHFYFDFNLTSGTYMFYPLQQGITTRGNIIKLERIMKRYFIDSLEEYIKSLGLQLEINLFPDNETFIKTELFCGNNEKYKVEIIKKYINLFKKLNIKYTTYKFDTLAECKKYAIEPKTMTIMGGGSTGVQVNNSFLGRLKNVALKYKSFMGKTLKKINPVVEKTSIKTRSTKKSTKKSNTSLRQKLLNMDLEMAQYEIFSKEHFEMSQISKISEHEKLIMEGLKDKNGSPFSKNIDFINTYISHVNNNTNRVLTNYIITSSKV
jgi:hypothetical protein